MAALLCAKDLCKTYVIDKRQNNVLKNVNLEVKEGEMVAIMGPSGSGKSTLLYAISGMDRATSGQVLFEGKDLTKLSEKELAKIRLDEMGFIFQQMYMMKILRFSITSCFRQQKAKSPGKAGRKSRKEASSLCVKWESSRLQITISTRFPADSFRGRVSAEV